MKREELMHGLHYASLPDNVRASTLINGNDKQVLMSLLDRLGVNEICWPGYAKIGGDCGLSRSCVKASVKRLAAVGAIIVTMRVKETDGDDTNDSNEYTINDFDWC